LHRHIARRSSTTAKWIARMRPWRLAVRAILGVSIVGVVGGLVLGVPVTRASVVGEWAFDEGDGQVAHDLSGSGLDGGLGIAGGADGADPAWVPGVAGWALRFDGGDAVVLPDSRTLEPQQVSIEAWVRRQGTPGVYAYVVSKGARACDTSSYGLYTGAGGGLAFYIADGGAYTVSPAAPPARVWDGAWHHVVGTFDGHSVRFYIDGGPVADGSPTDRTIVYGFQSTAPYLGTYRGGCELGFTGDIDDVRIWNSALTAAAVARSRVTQPGGASGDSAPAATAPVSGPPATVTPGCVVSVARGYLRAGRRSSIAVTVRSHARPLPRVRVLLVGKRLRLLRRTDYTGRARFVVRPSSSERRLSVRALGRRCRNTRITVRR
jgi:Concanavalin A-like lectin/glucanases superfamily